MASCTTKAAQYVNAGEWLDCSYDTTRNLMFIYSFIHTYIHTYTYSGVAMCQKVGGGGGGGTQTRDFCTFGKEPI